MKLSSPLQRHRARLSLGTAGGPFALRTAPQGWGIERPGSGGEEAEFPVQSPRRLAAWPLESHSVGSEQRYDVTNQFYRKRIRLQWDRRLGRRGEGARAEETAPGFTSERCGLSN